MAAGAVYYDADGVEHFQPAEVVILGLQRRGHAAPAAEFGLREVPERSRQFVGPRGAEPDAASPGRWYRAMSTSRWTAGVAPSTRSGASSSTRPTRRATSCAATRCSSAAAPVRPTRRSWGRLPASCHGARDHHRHYRQMLDHRLNIGVACEDLPEEHNRVTLDPVLKDRQRHTGAQDRLHDQREYAPHDGARDCPCRRDPGRSRRHPAVRVAHRIELSGPPCSARRGWARIRSARW